MMFTMFPDLTVNKFNHNGHQNELWLIENENGMEKVNYDLLPVASCSKATCDLQQLNENVNKQFLPINNNKQIISNKKSPLINIKSEKKSSNYSEETEDANFQLQCELIAKQLLQIADKFESEILFKRQKLRDYERREYYKSIFWHHSSIFVQFLFSTFLLNDLSSRLYNLYNI